ncbi:MAG: hypothetical protein KC777_04400 [Cyanobacteria bacterium HKST-UBA02]|nr:hypothetical protein [Cyanobacteria bacterium HKST-UBA02]
MLIESSITLSQLESLYQNIDSALGSELSPSISYSYAGAFGLEAALIQFIASWQRIHPQGEVVLDCDLVDFSDFLRKAYTHPSNITACYFGEKFTDCAHAQISKSAVLKLATPILEAMFRDDYRTITGSSEFALLCFRNHPNEFLPCLYEQPAQGRVRSRDQIRDLIEKILATQTDTSKQRLSFESLASSLGPLLHELIKNTDDHSLTDEDGNFYPKGVRGIIVKTASLDRGDLLSGYSGSNRRLTTYLNGRLSAVGRDTPRLTFLEVSVIDTGPGLARRWLSKDLGRPVRDLAPISIDVERKAVIDCFRKYMTTKPSDSSGMGLTAVLNHLQRLKGFLRLRTGRLSLFQALDKKQSEIEFSPHDWDKKLPMLPEAAGTTFTICVPVTSEATKSE